MLLERFILIAPTLGLHGETDGPASVLATERVPVDEAGAFWQHIGV